MNSYLAIISSNDEPIYTAEFFRNDFTTEKLVEQRSMNDFIIHSALDMIDKVWSQSNSYYMPIVDRYDRWMTSAFKMGSGDTLVLLHDIKNDDAIKNFFIDLHELYIKIFVNPFYERGMKITSDTFEVKVRILGKKYLEK